MQITPSPSSLDLTDATAAGRALLTAADTAAQRTALGLGTAATVNTGTTAGTIATNGGTAAFASLSATAATVGTGGLTVNGTSIVGTTGASNQTTLTADNGLGETVLQLGSATRRGTIRLGDGATISKASGSATDVNLGSSVFISGLWVLDRPAHGSTATSAFFSYGGGPTYLINDQTAQPVVIGDRTTTQSGQKVVEINRPAIFAGNITGSGTLAITGAATVASLAATTTNFGVSITPQQIWCHVNGGTETLGQKVLRVTKFNGGETAYIQQSGDAGFNYISANGLTLTSALNLVASTIASQRIVAGTVWGGQTQAVEIGADYSYDGAGQGAAYLRTTTAKPLILGANGIERLRIAPAGTITASGNLTLAGTASITVGGSATASMFIFSASTPPATATSAGVAGSTAYDTGYFYLATGINTWKRTPLSTF